eukprot:5274492-Prymnesium_polylepis.1
MVCSLASSRGVKYLPSSSRMVFAPPGHPWTPLTTACDGRSKLDGAWPRYVRASAEWTACPLTPLGGPRDASASRTVMGYGVVLRGAANTPVRMPISSSRLRHCGVP